MKLPMITFLAVGLALLGLVGAVLGLGTMVDRIEKASEKNCAPSLAGAVERG